MAVTTRSEQGTLGQSGSTATVSLTGVTAGSRLVVFVRSSSENRAVDSVSGGGTWADVVPGRIIANGAALSAWICENATGGDTTVTVTFDTSGANTVAVLLVEVLGLVSGSAALEVHSEAGQSTGTTLPTGAMVTLGDGRFILACGFTEGTTRTCGEPSGYTTVRHVTGASNEMRVASFTQPSAGSITTTFPVGGGNSPGAAIQLGLIVAAGAGGGGTTVEGAAEAHADASGGIRVAGDLAGAGEALADITGGVRIEGTVAAGAEAHADVEATLALAAAIEAAAEAFATVAGEQATLEATIAGAGEAHADASAVLRIVATVGVAAEAGGDASAAVRVSADVAAAAEAGAALAGALQLVAEIAAAAEASWATATLTLHVRGTDFSVPLVRAVDLSAALVRSTDRSAPLASAIEATP